MMPKYRKKPVVVEAVQWFPFVTIPGVDTSRLGEATVTTIQGRQVNISPGEWVITESDGIHHYPCSSEEFSRLYEPVGDHDNPKAQG